jgi:putative nucleotide binding protein
LRGNRDIHETHAYVLDVKSRARSVLFRSREGTIITALGERRFVLLEMLAKTGGIFEAGERVDVDERIQAVLGRLDYSRISIAAAQEVPRAIEGIVTSSESRFVGYLNTAGLVNTQAHSIGMLPGVGKALLKVILSEREARPFTSYADVEERTGWRDPAENLVQRIRDEMEGRTGTRLFVRG